MDHDMNEGDASSSLPLPDVTPSASASSMLSQHATTGPEWVDALKRGALASHGVSTTHESVHDKDDRDVNRMTSAEHDHHHPRRQTRDARSCERGDSVARDDAHEHRNKEVSRRGGRRGMRNMHSSNVVYDEDGEDEEEGDVVTARDGMQRLFRSASASIPSNSPPRECDVLARGASGQHLPQQQGREHLPPHPHDRRQGARHGARHGAQRNDETRSESRDSHTHRSHPTSGRTSSGSRRDDYISVFQQVARDERSVSPRARGREPSQRASHRTSSHRSTLHEGRHVDEGEMSVDEEDAAATGGQQHGRSGPPPSAHTSFPPRHATNAPIAQPPASRDVAAAAAAAAATGGMSPAARGGHGGGMLQHNAAHEDEAEEEAEGGGEDEGEDDDDDDIPQIFRELCSAPNASELTLSNAQLVAATFFLHRWWTTPMRGADGQALGMSDMVRGVADRFLSADGTTSLLEALDNGTLTAGDVKAAYERESVKRIRLEVALTMRGLITATSHGGGLSELTGVDVTAAGDGVRLLQSLGAAHENMCIANNTLLYCLSTYERMSGQVVTHTSAVTDVFTFMPPAHEMAGRLNPRIQLLIFVLRSLREHGFRRRGDKCYEQILSPPCPDTRRGAPRGAMCRQGTHAWREVCTIRDFIVKYAVRRETKFDMWCIMYEFSMLDTLVKWLTTGDDQEFRELKPDRMWHAFRNGLLHLETATFHPYGAASIPMDMVANVYHDKLFDTRVLPPPPPLDGSMVVWDWYTAIDTPYFDRIMLYQLERDSDVGLSNGGGVNGAPLNQAAIRSVMEWWYCQTGRMLFPLGTDNWQVQSVMLGVGGSGKSMYAKTVTSMYAPGRVATIGNDVQDTFGLEPLLKADAWIMTEARHNCRIDQSAWQSMVSGEAVTIACKGKEAVTLSPFTLPGLICGNELPEFTNNSESVSRRSFLFVLQHMIFSRVKDPLLHEKISRELPKIIYKCVVAYLFMLRKHGHHDLWGTYIDEHGVEQTVVPYYFHRNKARVGAATNPLAAFLSNEQAALHFDVGVGMPFTRFQALANVYFRDNGAKKFRWVDEPTYATVLEQFNINLVTLKADALVHAGSPDGFKYGNETYGVGTRWLWGVTERRTADAAPMFEVAADMMGDNTVARLNAAAAAAAEAEAAAWAAAIAADREFDATTGGRLGNNGPGAGAAAHHIPMEDGGMHAYEFGGVGAGTGAGSGAGAGGAAHAVGAHAAGAHLSPANRHDAAPSAHVNAYMGAAVARNAGSGMGSSSMSNAPGYERMPRGVSGEGGSGAAYMPPPFAATSAGMRQRGGPPPDLPEFDDDEM